MLSLLTRNSPLASFHTLIFAYTECLSSPSAIFQQFVVTSEFDVSSIEQVQEGTCRFQKVAGTLSKRRQAATEISHPEEKSQRTTLSHFFCPDATELF